MATCQIASLEVSDNQSTYDAQKKTVEVKVIRKEEKRLSRYGPSYFNMLLADASGKMKCNGYKDCIVKKFYNMFEENKVYKVTRFGLQKGDQRYTRSECTMKLLYQTIVEPCSSSHDLNNLPPEVYNRTLINEIPNLGIGEIIDVIGIIKVVSPLKIIEKPQPQERIRLRIVVLIDESFAAIRLALFGKLAEEFNVDENSGTVMACKNVQVKEMLGEKQVNLITDTFFEFNPDNEETHRLLTWTQEEGFELFFNTEGSQLDSRMIMPTPNRNNYTASKIRRQIQSSANQNSAGSRYNESYRRDDYKDYEPEAIRAYEMKYGKKVKPKIYKERIVEGGTLSAIPDGFVDDDIVLEVKCPDHARNKIISEHSVNFLYRDGDELKLKKDHKYYDQIMTQLFVFQKNICHFVIYTIADIIKIDIPKDEEKNQEIIECIIKIEQEANENYNDDNNNNNNNKRTAENCHLQDRVYTPKSLRIENQEEET